MARNPRFLTRSTALARLFLFCCALALLGATGCSALWWLNNADKEAYGIIRAKTGAVPGAEKDYRLNDERALMPMPPVLQAFLDGKPLPPLSLADAILIAAANSREFQTQRENVFFEALTLSGARYDFAPIFAAAFNGNYENNRGAEQVNGGSNFGLDWALPTGADLSVALSTTFLRFLTGDPRAAAQSLLSISLRQPLWRGSGRRVALENLKQAERNMVYQLREFTRFRRTFFVSVATEYYRILQQKDAVENERLNLKNLAIFRERAQMLSKAGRLPEFQVNQAEQDELRARDRWVRAVQRLEGQLDDFKLTLGVPAETPMELQATALQTLQQKGLPEVQSPLASYVTRALRHRLDMATAIEGVDDARRKIVVAKSNLMPDIDLVLSTALTTKEPTRAAKFRYVDSAAGVEIDLPVNRKDQRNTYRGELIDLDRALRSLQQTRDEIVLAVRNAWRALEEARETHRIQQRSVELGLRRVESTNLLVDAGRADMRDLLEAQESLLNARNSLTTAVVNYHITLLSLWRDTETLAFNKDHFEEVVPDAPSDTIEK